MKIKNILFNCLLIFMVILMGILAYRSPYMDQMRADFEADQKQAKDVHVTPAGSISAAIIDIKNARQRVAELMFFSLDNKNSAKYREISMDLTKIKVRLEELQDEDKPK